MEAVDSGSAHSNTLRLKRQLTPLTA